MRDPQKALANRLKHGRREWLVILLLAGSPALAQQPKTGSFSVLPPLPLGAVGQSTAIRSNPFCETEETKPQSTVQLTTGSNQPSRTVRLSPIGAAIGLNSIESDQRLLAPRPAGRAPAMTIEPTHRSAVQSNPLIQSAHHSNTQLVDTRLPSAKPVTKPASPAGRSSRIALAARHDLKSNGNSIVLVNPAPTKLLIVQPNQPALKSHQQLAASPLQPAGKPQQSLIPVSTGSVLALGNHAALPAKPSTATADKSVASPVTIPAATATSEDTAPDKSPEAESKSSSSKTVLQKTASKPAKPASTSRQKTVQPKKPTKSVQVASIAAMLSQHPSQPSKASTENTSNPIFFSLSDNLEVAPTSEAKEEDKLAGKTNSLQAAARANQPSLPAAVTLRADGSIVTSAPSKPKASRTKTAAAPTSVLADRSRLGASIGLPTPLSSPKPASQPVLMPKPPAQAKPIGSQPKSILALNQPATSAAQNQKISVAPIEGFKPRSNSKSTKSITAAKPFFVLGETDKSRTAPRQGVDASSETKIASAPAPSSLAKSPSISEPATAKTLNTKINTLTLPHAVNIPEQAENSAAGGNPSRSILKVERPSPKENAQTNPYLEAPQPVSKDRLTNPFKKPGSTSRSIAKSQSPVTIEPEANHAVTIKKYNINKQDRKHSATSDSAQRDEVVPIAKGVVKPISLGEPKEVAKPSQALANQKSQVDRSVANTPVPTGKPATDTVPEATKPASIAHTKPSANKHDFTPEPSILKKRYHPPVAVQTLPEKAQRQPAADSVNTPKVQSVTAIVLDKPKSKYPSVDLQRAMSLDTANDQKDRGLILGPEVKLTPLHMNQDQVRSLTLGGSVRGVRVGDKSICQAFASGPNQLKLIGMGIGVTRLVVWAQKNDKDDEVLMRAFEIHVEEVVPSEGNSIENTTELLNQSIRNAFPNCRVEVKLVGGELWVGGRCGNQDSAEKIIRMVRKSRLIPVRDQLEVK